jgi:hypothetical protein
MDKCVPPARPALAKIAQMRASRPAEGQKMSKPGKKKRIRFRNTKGSVPAVLKHID